MIELPVSSSSSKFNLPSSSSFLSLFFSLFFSLLHSFLCCPFLPLLLLLIFFHLVYPPFSLPVHQGPTQVLRP